MRRREFIRHAVLGTLAAPWLGGCTEQLLTAPLNCRPDAPVRISGRVVSRGKGLRGVAITDGVRVKETNKEGYFDFVSSTASQFVTLSLPRGFSVPVSPTGSASLHRPICPDANGELHVLFELEPSPVDDTRHALFLLADPQIRRDQEVREFLEFTVPDLSRTVASLGGMHSFGIGCGDLVEDRLDLFPEYERVASIARIPFFQVKGNHDIDFRHVGIESAVTYMQRYGPTYYSFDRGDIHYVVLDDVDWTGDGYQGHISETQLDWLRSDLERIEAGRVVVIVTHIPIFSTLYRRRGGQRLSPAQSVDNRAELYDILGPYRVHILSAHMHENEHVFEGGVHEHVHGAVCGAWWTGPICQDGTPNGYALYEINGESISWRYKATGYPFEYQLRAYPQGADPTRPGDYVINIWNWDPEWEVLLYSGGQRIARLFPETGYDPIALRIFEGDSQPPGKTWIQPVKTNHIFYVAADGHASDLTVEATDRFGNVFFAALPRSLEVQVPG